MEFVSDFIFPWPHRPLRLSNLRAKCRSSGNYGPIKLASIEVLRYPPVCPRPGSHMHPDFRPGSRKQLLPAFSISGCWKDRDEIRYSYSSIRPMSATRCTVPAFRLRCENKLSLSQRAFSVRRTMECSHNCVALLLWQLT